MYFERLSCDSFGRFEGDISLAPDRINLIQAPNESGKSTIVRAILGALYGLVSDRCRASNEENLTERDLFKPWDAQDYRVTLDLGGLPSLDGPIRIERDFEEEGLTVLDRSEQKDITDSFDEERTGEPGKQLTGLSRSVFEKSLLVHQDDVALHSASGDLIEAIQRLADSSAANVTARRARTIIQQSLMNFTGKLAAEDRGLSTEIDWVANRIEEIDEKLLDLRKKRERAEEKVKRADELQRRIQEIEDELDRIELFETIARKRECDDALREHARQQKKLEELKREREELKEYEGFPHGQQEHLFRSHEHRKQLIEERTSCRDEEQKLQEEITQVREAIHNLNGYDRLDTEEVDRLLEFCEQALHYRRELNASREALSAEEEKVEGHEALLEEYHRLQQIFRGLESKDREFLGDMGQQLRTLSDEAAESEREISEAEQEIQSIDRERFRMKVRHAILSVIFGLFIGIGGVLLVWIFDVEGIIGYGLTLAGVSGAVYSIFQWVMAERHRSDERSQWQVKLEHQMQRQKERARTRAVNRRRASLLAGRLGLESVQDLLGMYERYRDLYDELSSILEIDAQVRRQRKKLKNMIRSHESLLASCDPHLSEAGSVKEFESLMETLGQLRRYRKRVADLETKQASTWADRSALERKIEAEERNMRAILSRAGIDLEECTLDEAVEEFSRQHEKYIRLQTVKQKIPAVKEGMLTPRKREETERIREQLQEHLEHIRKKWDDVEVPDELASREQYRQRRNTLDGRKQTLIANHADLEREVGAIESRFRDQYAELQNEKEQLKGYRNRLVRLNRSAELALDVLGQVSRDVHADWARTLNEEVSDIVERITTGYSDVRFNADLSFSLSSDQQGETLTPTQVRESLSEGTRNQVYLAVRLGLGRYLTDDETPLPIVLDESFAQWDDTRFRRAWSFITEEFVPEHQMIYLTCHPSRMDWLREQDPEWFDTYFSGVEI